MQQKPDNKIFKEWSLVYDDYVTEKEKSRESLLTIGNGYMGIRGALEEFKACQTNYPGTYIAGLYNRLVSKVADRDIENEDFVNTPNWMFVDFNLDGENWFSEGSFKILSINRELNFKNGTLAKELIVQDSKGNKTKIKSTRFASMFNQHVAGLKYSIQPINYTGSINIKSQLDGNIINGGVARYNDLNQKHLQAKTEGTNGKHSWISVETTQSAIEIAVAAKHSIIGKPTQIESSSKPGESTTHFSIDLKVGQEFVFEKIVAIHTSKPDDVPDPLSKSKEIIEKIGDFDSELKLSDKAWGEIWDTIDIQIKGDVKSQMLIRLHLYHLMVAASPNNVNIDAGIAARGLHGEAYRGHIFWDELYILPLYNIFFPKVAKSVLNYRVKRIEKARAYAKEHGYKGAMYPWQSGSDGREETQTIHLNPISGKWGDDYSSLQRHISIAIAYNTWYYVQVTNDFKFLEEGGAEMFLEICRFWASKSKLGIETGKYSISKVMGPDEFHEEHKNSEGGGVKDNAYTNIMVAWLFSKAEGLLKKIPESSATAITSKINLTPNEIVEWSNIAKHLNIPVSKESIIEQFDGYFDLKELDWDAYREKYKNIYRLDRILKAEGKSPDDYKLAKQADTLMTFYNIDEEDISQILQNSGASISNDYLEKNYHYYLERTSHGSTLSRVVHAYLANIFGDKELANELYFDALASDYTDIQGGTTAEGIHAGVMGGTVLMAFTSYGGINLKKELLHINPSLPKKWKSLKFKLAFKNNLYELHITPSEIKIIVNSEISKEVGVVVSNKKIILPTNKQVKLNY